MGGGGRLAGRDIQAPPCGRTAEVNAHFLGGDLRCRLGLTFLMEDRLVAAQVRPRAGLCPFHVSMCLGDFRQGGARRGVQKPFESGVGLVEGGTSHAWRQRVRDCTSAHFQPLEVGRYAGCAETLSGQDCGSFAG
jgi:hypothetical protein